MSRRFDRIQQGLGVGGQESAFGIRGMGVCMWRRMFNDLMPYLAICCLLIGGLPATLRSQDGVPKADAPADSAGAAADSAGKSDRALAEEQRRLAEDYARLEQKLRRLAQVSAATDPARAALLKQAFAESKQRFLAGQLEALAKSLGDPTDGTGPAFDQVLEGQTKVQTDIKALIDLLQNESQAKAAESETRRLKELAKRLGRIIRSQEGISGRTESGEDEKKLAADQAELADRTGELQGDVEKDDAAKSGDAKGEGQGQDTPAAPKPGGMPPGDKQPGDMQPGNEGAPKATEPSSDMPGDAPAEGKPQGDAQGEANPGSPMDSDGETPQGEQENPLNKRLKNARQAMREAQKKLDEAKRKDAAAEQQKALDELKAAQAEIEKILRQMREEQVQRTLVALEQRFRVMLDAQIAVFDETKQLDKTPADQRSAEDDIKAGRVGRKQQEIVLMSERALALLREEGSAPALAEAVEQVSGDMRTVAELLAQSRVDLYTQQIEQDVITALDEILAAVKQAQEDAKKPKQPPGEMGEPGEPPLVDGLAELKMLRTMQVRVNRRLKQIADLVQADETNDPQMRKGLDDLAARQKKLVEITRDIVTGKTE